MGIDGRKGPHGCQLAKDADVSSCGASCLSVQCSVASRF